MNIENDIQNNKVENVKTVLENGFKLDTLDNILDLWLCCAFNRRLTMLKLLKNHGFEPPEDIWGKILN